MDILDIEFNETAAFVSLAVAVLVGIFLFGDPMNVGMDSVPLFGRIFGTIAGLVVGYIIADRMID